MWLDPRSRSRSRGFRIPKIALVKVYLLSHLQWELANDHRFLNCGTISKFDRAGFLIFVLLFMSRDLELGAAPVVSPSTKEFFRFQWNLVCSLDRGRWPMHEVCRMTDPRSKSRSRGLWSSENCTLQGLSLPPFTMGAGKWPSILKVINKASVQARRPVARQPVMTDNFRVDIESRDWVTWSPCCHNVFVTTSTCCSVSASIALQ